MYPIYYSEETQNEVIRSQIMNNTEQRLIFSFLISTPNYFTSKSSRKKRKNNQMLIID